MLLMKTISDFKNNTNWSRHQWTDTISYNTQSLYKEKVMRVYVSEEGHSSIDKAMDILGLGSENLVKVKRDKN